MEIENLSTTIFEKTYLYIRDILNWQNRQKQKKLSLPEGVEKKTYSYSDTLSHIRKCNIYHPKGSTEPLPLIIDIHGGGWIYGDKDVYDDYNALLVEKGNAVSSLTYRTIDQADLVDQVQDIFEYLHFLKNNQQELNISLDQVMLTGDSAGAQLSLLCFCINQSEELQELFNVKPVEIDFDALCLTHPVCFIDQAGKIPTQNWLSEWLTIPGLQTMLYGKSYEEGDIYKNSVNPSVYLSDKIKFPPILLVTSEGDIMFKYQTFLLADLFSKLNIDYELFIEGNRLATHVYNVSNPLHELSDKCNQVMLDFFAQSVRKND